MDTRISSWTLEFLLRQNIDEWILSNLILILRPEDADYRLIKAILLRRITSFVSEASVSESILKTLEIMEEIHHRTGTKTSDSMKKAYSSVAVECTVKFLREEPEDYSAFGDAVSRIWKGRIAAMRRWDGGVGLVSEELWSLEKDMLSAVGIPDIRSKMREVDTRKEALDSLRAFLDEEVEEMGPPFLQVAALLLFEKDGVNNCESFGENLKGGRVRKWPMLDLSEVDVLDAERNVAAGAKKICKPPSGVEDHREGIPHTRGKDASIEDTAPIKDAMTAILEEVGVSRWQNKCDVLSSAEVLKVKKALKSSTIDLQQVVEDPLPDALEIAAGIVDKVGNVNAKGLDNNQNQSNVEVDNYSVEKAIDDHSIGDFCTSKHNIEKQVGKSRPGFMEWNKTAHTYEWDDSIDSPSEASPPTMKRPYLPSPERNVISPLKKQEVMKFNRRRKMRKWSLTEEETLREAVKKCGVGNWKFILESHRYIFQDRTTIDLKDKWRNMTR